jgi:ATP-dependent DNA helicase RecQ
VQTLKLVQDGLSLEQIVDQRDLNMSTILNHLEELQELGKLPLKDVLRLADGKIQEIENIKEALGKLGDEKLRPIFDHFEGQHSYDEIKLARIIYRAKPN